MSRRTQDRTGAPGPETSLRRLLQALAEPGASAARNELDGGATLVVRAAQGRVTLVKTCAPTRDGDLAVDRGLARWSRGAAARLYVTEAGHAWLRRAATPKALDPYQAQHADYELRPLEKGARPVLINAAESPVAWLARRKDRDGRSFLNPAQIEAGERLRRDFEQAQLLQRVTANWEAPGGSAPFRVNRGEVPAVAMDARRRIRTALDTMEPDYGAVLTDACLWLKGLQAIERERGIRPRGGKIVLRRALDELARHYGVGAEAKGPLRAKGVTHWGAQDYRPQIDPVVAED